MHGNLHFTEMDIFTYFLKSISDEFKLNIDEITTKLKNIIEELEDSEAIELKLLLSLNHSSYENKKTSLHLLIFTLYYGFVIEWNSPYRFLNRLFIFKPDSGDDIYETEFFKCYRLKETKCHNIGELKSLLINIPVNQFFSTRVNGGVFMDEEIFDVDKFGSNRSRYNQKAVQAYKLSDEDKIHSFYDIDGILGAVTSDNMITAIKGSLVLDLDLSKEYCKTKFMTKKYYFETSKGIKDVTRCDNTYLGYFNLTIGKLNLFLVFPDKKNNLNNLRSIRILDLLAGFMSNTDHLIQEAAILVNLNEVTRTMKGNLGVNLFGTLLRYIERYLTYTDEFIFFVEIYGNKKYTTSNLLFTTFALLDQSLDLLFMPYVKIDICITKAMQGYLINVNPEYYKYLKIRPNYHIMCNPVTNNLHTNCLKLTENRDSIINKCVYTQGYIEKINIYTTIEDVTKEIRSDYSNFMPKISLAMFRRCILNDGSKNSRVVNLVAKIKKVAETDTPNNIPMRIEVRVSPVFMLDVINNFDLNEPEVFYKIKIDDVTCLMKTVLNQFLEAIPIAPTIESIAKLAVLENILQSIFLKGTKNLHFHPENEAYKLDKYIYDPDFLVSMPEFDYHFESSFTKNRMFKMMYSLYVYQENSTKVLPDDVDKLLTYSDLTSSLKFVITTLIADMGCYMGSLIDRLDENLTNNNIISGNVSFTHIYNRFFKVLKNDDDEHYRKLPYYQLYKLVKYQYSVEISDIKEVFRMMNIKYFYEVHCRKKSIKVVNLDYSGAIVMAKEIETVLVDTLKHHASFNIPGRLALRPNELINFFWALAYKEYKNMTWSQMHDNAFFGLMLTRCHTRVKEKIASTKQKLKNRQHELTDLYERASLYDPRNYDFNFRYDEVLYFYREANNEDFKTAFKALYDHQAANYQHVDSRCLYDILHGIRTTSVFEPTCKNDYIAPQIAVTNSNLNIGVDSSYIYDNDIYVETITEFDDDVIHTEQKSFTNILDIKDFSYYKNQEKLNLKVSKIIDVLNMKSPISKSVIQKYLKSNRTACPKEIFELMLAKLEEKDIIVIETKGSFTQLSLKKNMSD